MKTKRMTKKAQRIAIAEDVIKSLDAKLLEPSHIYFFRNFNAHTMEYGEECHVCALGACLVGMNHINNLPLPHVSAGMNQIKSELTKIFSRKQLILIECAYEGYDHAAGIARRDALDEPTQTQVSRAYAFGKRYKDDGERMRAIMENIIRNGGQFKI